MNELFKIFLIDPAELNKMETATGQPRKYDYEELIIGIEGDLEHFIDFKLQILEAPFIVFVTKGKVHRMVPKIKDDKCKIWILRFKSEFIPETAFQLYSFYHDQANISLINNACFARFADLCEMIDGETKQEMPEYSVIKQLLNALFTMVEVERKKLQFIDDEHHKSLEGTFKKFLKILEENFRSPAGVNFYAEKLFISTRSLNNICHNILQKSVSEIIETRKLIEAKNLLTSTEKSISEIGFELGYNEKSYFTSVFKKKSGKTPTVFREEMRKLF